MPRLLPPLLCAVTLLAVACGDDDTEKAAWNEVFKKVRNALKAEGKLKAEVFDEVQTAAQ